MNELSASFEDAFRVAFCTAGNPENDPEKSITSEQLFSEWFRVQGDSHFFLFKKNLSVTSLQHAELLSLIRTHIRDSEDDAEHVQFITIDDFFTSLRSLLLELRGSKLKRVEIANSLLELYGNWLRCLVVVELFYGSCTVFIPPHLDLDLYSVCRESGYIHSCGNNIYTRRFEELDSKDIIETLKKHIEKIEGSEKRRIYVSVYAHEDFTSTDRKSSSELAGGLDESKIFIEKYFVGDKPFVTFIDRLENALGDKVYIPSPGPYREQREKALEDTDLDQTRTIWFIVDREISANSRYPGNQRYLICYEQKYKNYNPFHIFDENKPAWVSHTTIPHTLVGAMLNITRPWWPKKRNVIIADPFSGTGTVWLECHKFEDIELRCSDLAPIAPLLAEDNRKFFSLSLGDLDKLKNSLGAIKIGRPILAEPEGHHKTTPEESSKCYDDALKIFNDLNKLKIDEQLEEFEIPEKIVKQLGKNSFETRLLFYICLRAHVRHAGSFERRSEPWTTAFLYELDALTWQIEELAKLRRQEAESEHKSKENLGEFMGTYSLGAGVPALAMKKRDTIRSVILHDARKKYDESVDVIVTDPPYGFNTDEKTPELAQLYSESLRAMISSLKDGGQIVIAVPQSSYTGRRVAVFSTKTWLSQQVLAEARHLGYEVVVSAQLFPRPGGIFFPPYYWESAKALGRSILHFRFKKL